MHYPPLPHIPRSRVTVDAFGGYDHNLRIPDGAFYEMQNLCSDRYPVLCPRQRRGEISGPAAPQGIIVKDALCYVDGGDFVMNGYHVALNLTPGPKRLTSMGAYVVILPDKCYINTLNLTDHGPLDAAFTTSGPLTATPCDAQGTERTPAVQEPDLPENGQLWLDGGVLKEYSASAGLWVAVEHTYVKLHSPGIGAAFGVSDGITLSGLTAGALNGAAVVWARDTDFLVIPGLLTAPFTQDAPVTAERKMPEVDFLLESGNRLWGCRYGLSADGQVVNEIYASRLGDFKNWNTFLGVATDSYRASCGTDGPFTGAIAHLGYPLFFKEHCVHKVYGSYPASFQIQVTALRGVQKGSGSSLAIVGDTLYYKSPSGVCAYDGSLPVEVSQALGDVPYHSAVGGVLGNKYYLSMLDRDDAPHLFVLDTRRGLWHREDSLRAEAFCGREQELYALCGSRILALHGGGSPAESAVPWMAVTGELGLNSPEHKYITQLNLRLQLEPGAELRIFAQYDGIPGWESLGCIRGRSLAAFRLPLRPRRCSHLRLKLAGTGDIRLYSLNWIVSEGSDRP